MKETEEVRKRATKAVDNINKNKWKRRKKRWWNYQSTEVQQSSYGGYTSDWDTVSKAFSATEYLDKTR